MQAENTEIDLAHYWRILRRQWLPALFAFGVTAAAVGTVGFLKDPLYTAEGKVRVKRQDDTSVLAGLADERGKLSSLDGISNPISTEIGLMRTVPVIRETIERLNLRDAEDELVDPQALLSKLDITHESETDILQVVIRLEEAEIAKYAVDTLMAVYLEQHLRENRAEAVAAREFIEKQLPDAEQRALQAEAALRDFKERNQIVALDEETTKTVFALSDVTDKITDINSQLSDTQAQFNIFRDRVGRNPQTALAATAVSQSEGVQQVLREYQQVESELATERVRFQDQHPTIVDLQNRLDNLSQLLSDRVGDVAIESGNVPTNLQLGEAEIDLVGDYIRLEAQLNGLRNQAQVLLSARDSYANRANILPQLEQEQRQLERQLEAAQSTYSLLLQRLQEVLVVENQNVGNVRIIQPAEVLGASSPLNLYLAAGTMLGTLMAISVAFLLAARDKSIKSVEDAKDSFGLSVLGIIPSFGETGAIARRRGNDERMIPRVVVSNANFSPYSEAFHMLRNNLKFFSTENPPKTIVVTSSVANEGKSTVASNLAASMAQTGQRVLLIDADLIRPIQHWVWQIPDQMGTANGTASGSASGARSGLSDMLAGQSSLNHSITEVMPNLMVMLAGTPLPNPVALLDSQRMLKLLEVFQAQFDYIILDSPPLSGGAITSVLGKMSDGLLLVVRPEIADAASANYCKELIERSHQNVLGIVVNGTLPEYEPYGVSPRENAYRVGASSAHADIDISADVMKVDATSGSR
ncbi:MAG: polysaccharide biosynthesis tyrosine autokinase [Phormidesmis sp. RL_2_1]|nr:polysaccharide biosynthesis tyrosine autokinase [Phormidesmis sp. RL_2_1]